MVEETIGNNPLHIQEAASTDDTNTGSELVVLENKPQLGDLQQYKNDGKEEEKETTSTTAEELATVGQSQATSCCTWWVLPPWLFSLQASYAAGVIWQREKNHHGSRRFLDMTRLLEQIKLD